MPDAGILATILLIVGLFLLALELMIPSFGMIGILSAITLLISAWSAWQAWWGTSPGFFWTYAAFWVLGIPSVLGGMLFMLQHTSLGDRVVLRGPMETPVQQAQKQHRLTALVGQMGKTASLLTPGGMVVIDNERFHAESLGMVIESGTSVQVIDISGNRLVVKAVSAETQVTDESVPAENSRPTDRLADTVALSPEAKSALTNSSVEGEGAGTLDFEIPEG